MKVLQATLLLAALAGCGNHPLKNVDGGADRTPSIDLAPAMPDLAVATPDVGLPSPDVALPSPDLGVPSPDVAPPVEVHPRPPLGDFGAPCGSRVGPYGWIDCEDGYTWFSECPGNLCLRFLTSDGCTHTGCTAACMNDDDCPLGWYCDGTLVSRTQAQIGNLPVCRPEPRGAVPTSLTCASNF